MPLKIYNSLTRQKEEFKPLNPPEVRMYVCGPTVYDEPHMGHLRSAYVFEVIRRYLEYSGHKVRFVRNVTDIDDKIIEKSKEAGQSVEEVSAKYYQSYQEELEAFGIRKPDEEPRATEYVQGMVALIQKLVERGFAYAHGGDVYYRVGAFGNYGKLSGQKKESMLEGVRLDPNEKKDSPLDFALWKCSKEGEPSWPSPWGPGRPGWHIECSVMSMTCLKSETIDIHGGGRDLIFPHHENEIAQSEAATGKKFANFWIHHGLVTRDGHKMSKSLRNSIFVRELAIEQKRRAEQFKLFFLGAHYGAPLDYTEEVYRMQEAIWKKYYYFFNEVDQIQKKNTQRDPTKLTEFEIEFKESMDDDFNTPKALAVSFEVINHARKARDPKVILQAGFLLKSWLEDIFGIQANDPGMVAVTKMVDQARLNKLAFEACQKREAARRRKDFITADEIRSEFVREAKDQMELIDLSDGTTIYRVKVA